MKIDRLILGDFQTNCYVVRQDEAAVDCVIIDPGLDSDQLLSFLSQHNLHPVVVVLTHGHVDHIAGVPALRQQYPKIKVYVHKADAGQLTDAEANLSAAFGSVIELEPAEVQVREGDMIDEAGVKLKVLHTPGHTLGGICLYAESAGVVFSGDALFADSIGRSDFPGGDMDQLLDSIRTKLYPLPDKTVVYPGHGMRTTIGREKRANPFVQG